MTAEHDREGAQGCEPMAELFAGALAENPPSLERPWHIILGFDEFAPGNKLKVDNSRKCMNLSFTFLEFGQSVWCTEVAWFTSVFLLSSVIGQAVGGWSHLLRLFLNVLLIGPLGFESAGVPIRVQGKDVLIFAKLSNIISDGDGFRVAYDWRGHASMRPCLRHWNVLRKDSNRALRSHISMFSGCPLSQHKPDSSFACAC